jgi:predicted secreted hydrolase
MKRLKYFLPLIIAPFVAVAVFFGYQFWTNFADGAVGERAYLVAKDAPALERPDFQSVPPMGRKAFDFSRTNMEFPQEWWYFNAHMFDAEHRRYGLMIAMLKTGQVLGSLTLVSHEKHYGLQRSGVVEQLPRKLMISGPTSQLIQVYPGRFEYEFRFRDKLANFVLRMSANKKPLTVGGTGNVEMGASGRSFYYSLTNMTVKGRGRIRGNQVELAGKGWMDHQWGDWNDREFDKWYWYSIQLADNTEIMIFEFRRHSQVLSPVCDVVFPDGTTKHDLEYTIAPMKTWVSTDTGRSWSLGWQITIPEVGAKLEMVPDMDDQEVTKSLWEGVCKVDGEFGGKPAFGLAFYEARQRTW